MPGKRVSMRKTREVLRLYFDLKLGQRQVARSANISQSTVHEYLERFTATGLKWPLPSEMSETELEAALFPADPGKGREPAAERALPDFAHIHEELQQHKHTTRQLLWEEYRTAHPDGYNYSRFCYLYQRWTPLTMCKIEQSLEPGICLKRGWKCPVLQEVDAGGVPCCKPNLEALLNGRGYSRNQFGKSSRRDK